MKKTERIVNALFRRLYRIFFRINTEVLDQLPLKGPYILILNHPSVFEGPALYVHAQPRTLTALAKDKLWQGILSGRLMRLWNAIPVGPQGLDRVSMKQCFDTLDAGHYLCIAPEGIRTDDPCLHPGKTGAAYLAFKKQVPIVPVATVGFHAFKDNLKRLRRTPVTITAGEPFVITIKEKRLTLKLRQELTDEIMLRLAQLMPREYWGYYRDRELEFTHTRLISETSNEQQAAAEN